MRLTNAILCQDATVLPDGDLQMYNPYRGTIVPASEREAGKIIMVRLGRLVVVLALAGGRGSFTIDMLMRTPVRGFEHVRCGAIDLQWPEHRPDRWYLMCRLSAWAITRSSSTRRAEHSDASRFRSFSATRFEGAGCEPAGDPPYHSLP